MTTTPIPLSVLDLAPITPGQNAGESFANSVALAQAAERAGYTRIWYAEHHNMASVASSATAVLIGHIADHTTTIRVGAGGVMLPNHSPLVIAEQFGTLAAMHPGRIDLGLGRAPGGDQATMQALRRDLSAVATFPDDVTELRDYFRDQPQISGVHAVPGAGEQVPLFILGSSTSGAGLAARLGLPFAFASHFAPDALMQAIELYRREFTSSAENPRPYVIAGVNVVASQSEADAQAQFAASNRIRVREILDREATPQTLSDDAIDALIASPQGQSLARLIQYSAVGTPDAVADYLNGFAARTGADELILAHQSVNGADRVRSVELTADAMQPAHA